MGGGGTKNWMTGCRQAALGSVLAGIAAFFAGTNVGANSTMMSLQSELGRLAGMSITGAGIRRLGRVHGSSSGRLRRL